MNKVKITLIIVLLAVVTVFWVNSSNNLETEKIKVGVISPLTGPAASLSEDLQRTLQMYSEKAENIEFVFQDDQCSGKGAISAYNVLKNQGIKIYIGNCSGSILALAPILKEDNNVMLTAFGGSIEIRKTGNEVIRFIPDGLSVAEEMVSIIKENPDKKYALFHEQQDYSQSVADFIINEIGDQIVIHEVYSTEDNSFKTQLTKISASSADEMIFIPVSETAAQIVYKDMNDLSVNIPVFGDVNVCDQIELSKEFKVSGKCLKTVLQTEGYKNYLVEFSGKYGKEPVYPFYNAITFDIAYVLDNDLESIDNVDDSVIEKLKKDVLAGVNGQITSYEFQPNGEVIKKSEYLKIEEF